jgi:hypothetical protein
MNGLDVEGLCGELCLPGISGCDLGESCIPIPTSPATGACMPGPACDPTTTNVCLDGIPKACVELKDAPAQGACLTGCSIHGYLPCPAEAPTCSVKQGIEWHDGICVGQEGICDPVSQVGCPSDETCVIGGGPAYGGLAYYCNVNTGALQEGAACVDGQADCAPGLICYEDTCASFCKPDVTNCGVGTCNDVSFVYNLPAAFIGICQ